MNNELVAMQTFLSVVESRSFSAAAKRLGVAQSTVSRRVADLEGSLEVALLARTTREVRPTDAGRSFYRTARVALDAVEAARSSARTESQELSGTLRLGCSTLFGDAWLAPRLSRWLDRHPSLRLEVQLRNNHVDLVEAGLDVALRFGGPPTTELRGRPLRRYERVLFASPQWIEQHGAPQSPQDLLTNRVLMYGAAGESIWTLNRGEERVVLRPDSFVSATAGGFLGQLALNHVGPVLAPEWLLEGKQHEQLVRILPQWTGSQMLLWAVWPNHDFRRAAVRRFVDWIVEEVKRPDEPAA